jgi:iron-sulfur cluster repair protein YtfE (RIC family)
MCRTVHASPGTLDEVRHSLLSTASMLDRALTSHLEQEEQIVLPAIRTQLTPKERATMLTELRTRR